jgi:DNA-binding SARP family transcriptional activator
MDFRILGPLEVADGDRLIPLSGGKQRALLTILLLHANEVVSSDRLIDELWPDDPPASGATALQVRISQLRKALGPGGQLVVTKPPGYVIQLGRDDLDVHRFEELLHEAEGTEPAHATELLREALSLWRGPALADIAYEAFAQPAIGRLEELRLLALERRIDADLALGRHAQLVAELETLVAGHPLREGLRAQLILALYRSGRQADALDAYKATRRALVEELGIDPTSALQQLELAVLRHDPALDLARPESPQRSLLVVVLDDAGLSDLLAVAAPLATRPPRELVIARILPPGSELGPAGALLEERRQELVERGVAARTASFTSANPSHDAVRLATEQDVDLLLVEGSGSPLEDATVLAILAAAPCDVGVLVGRDVTPASGPVLVPFGSAEHDWTAVELGAWLAGSLEVPLRLAGPKQADRDASRQLASASLIVQRVVGIAAEPLLLDQGAKALVQAAEEARLVVVGLTDRWQREGLGPVRQALATTARPPVLLARSGLRPGGLAPRESLTRFTWSIGPGSP